MSKDQEINKSQFGVLAGVKVVGAVNSVAGPFCCCMFAENGADVIVMENTRAPDPLRYYPYWYAQEHRNQRNIAVNMAAPGGQEIFRRLMETADVFVESSKARTYDKWGFSDEELWQINPKLVIVHISGFGQDGDPEYYTRGSYDYIGQAFSGIVLHNGSPAPALPAYLKPNGGDFITGLQATWGAMAALYNAQRTGKGESVDVSQYESMLRIQSHYPTYGVMHGAEATRYTDLDPNMAGDAFYLTKDGKYMTIQIAGVGPLTRGLKLLGLSDDPGFEGIVMVMKYHDCAERFVQAIRDYCIVRTAEEVEKSMNDMQIPCTVSLTYADMAKHPHFKARNDFIEYHSPFANEKLKGVAAFPKFKLNPQQIWRGGGCFGQENEDILREYGFSEEQIRKYFEEEVVVTKPCVDMTESEKIKLGEVCGISPDNLKGGR